AYDDRGHKIYYLTFPDGMTWGYDAASGEWHRRQSYGFDRWRINDLTRCYGQWLAGDFTNGVIYRLDWNAAHENGQTLERRRTLGVLNDSGNRIIVNGVKLSVDTGQPQVPSLALYGSLGSQTVGETVDFAYRAAGGIPPYILTVTSAELH